MRMRLAFLVVCLLAACGSDGKAVMDLSMDLRAPADLSVPNDLTIVSICGHPGDPGNSLGVGRYCVVQSDCSPGTICTHPFVAEDYFCTLACSLSNPTACGENAVCACQNNQCGCLPAACTTLPHD